MVGMATLCAVLLTGCSGSDPSDSVMELVKNGDIEQAQQIYAEKISGKEEYESSFAEKFIPYLENLIESYNNGELSEEKINDDFETYKEMLGENVTFKDVESQLSALEISKHCFETAEKLRWEGELTQAYRMYARVIKKDRCYETAQQYITQIPADYLSESEDLFEGGQYQEAVRQSILGYALLDDKSGFDEIAIKVTKRLAEDYGFDNAAVSHQYADLIQAPVISRFCEAWGSPVHNDKAVAVLPEKGAQVFYQQLLAAQLPTPSDGSAVNVQHTYRSGAASRDIPGQRSFPVACAWHLWAQ